MSGQRADRRLTYAAVACGVALAVAGAGDTAPRTGHTPPKAAPAAPGTGGRTTSASGSARAVLQLRSALHFFYLPRYSAPAGAPFAPEYRIVLHAPEQAVRKVAVSFDLSVFKGKADVYGVPKGYGCVRSGFHVNCALGDVRTGESPDFLPFHVKPKPDTAPGPAGAVTVTVRSANAPTIRHTTQVIVGSPYLTSRQDFRRITGVRPGGPVSITPAFGNKGDTGVTGGITLMLSTDEATLPLRYRNCRYDKAVGATRAQCDLPGPLPAGAAFETAGPVTAVADRTAKSGTVDYGVWRTADLDPLSRLPASAPRGTGEPLRLRPVDGGAFTGILARRSESAGARVEFDTTGKYDVEAVGFTIEGGVGQVVDTQVPYPRGYGWGAGGGYDDLWVTLPEGVSLVEVDPESHSGDFLYCRPGPRRGGPVACPGPEAGGTLLRVRIDRRVQGARGSVTAPSDRAVDPDQSDNTAPVAVRYLP
ncbi:hypothetical protein [Streptomyces naganishii]|uniref:Uncharacterized protein n=1 Tax=Streptomyces naganishii JCM 4654 TaxID=1306179 RepID=A0A918Y108_9ACTN|nr:hypothetical protein [Streptomyces naganishii]GHD87350.1 hypothetical protein GCM10010508_19130 [Streptomyces naganishii JCM 4654]